MSRSLTKLLTYERKFGYNEGQKVNVTNPTNETRARRSGTPANALTTNEE